MPRLLITPDLLSRKKAETLTDLAFNGRWKTLKGVAEDALKATSREWLPTYATMSLLTGDPRWAAKASQMIEGIPDGPAIIAADRGKPVGQEVFQLAIAYDWMFDRLTPAAQAKAKLLLETWGKFPWPETNPARKANDWGVEMPWDNYFWSFLCGSWLAGLALGENDFNGGALVAASKIRWDKGSKWLLEHQPGGIFAEGSSYGAGTLVSILLSLSANLTATGEALPAWANSAMLAIITQTTPGMGGKAPWGDQASSYPALHSDLDRLAVMLLANFGDLPISSKTWLNSIVRNRSKRGESAWFEYLLYPTGTIWSEYAPVLFDFDKPTGYFQSRSGIEKDAIQVSAMCGPTWSTHQDAAGSFYIVRGNDWLIGHAKTTSASGLQHGAEYVNCITVDNRGQDNTLDKSARVLRCEDNEKFSLWQCEAGQAYDYSVTSSQRIKPLKSWRRTLVFLKPNIVIVHDRIEKNNPASVVKLHINTKRDPSEGAVVIGASEVYITGVMPNPVTATSVPLKLGPGGAVSSYRWDIEPKTPQAVEEFLVVYQAGAVNFSPIPPVRTLLGVRVRDDEVQFLPDGTVQFVDHRVTPRDQALEELSNAVLEWMGDESEFYAQSVIASARKLLDVA